jgi:hypothetical protein
MKRLSLLLLMTGVLGHAQSQFVHKINADSVLITNDSCTAELNLENSTKHIKGFLYNKGNGRTEFRKAAILNDSTFVFGEDTLVIRGSGSGAWKLTGNAGTNTTSNFIGTTDNTGFNIRTNNVNRISVNNNGSAINVNADTTFFQGNIKASSSIAHNNLGLFTTASDFGILPAYESLSNRIYLTTRTSLSTIQGPTNMIVVSARNTANFPTLRLTSIYGGTFPNSGSGHSTANFSGVIGGFNYSTTTGGVHKPQPLMLVTSQFGEGEASPGQPNDIILRPNARQDDYSRRFGDANVRLEPTGTGTVFITASNGYSQLRLASPYTPTSSADANGGTGTIAWDDNFIYIKTSSGWKRAAISTF